MPRLCLAFHVEVVQQSWAAERIVAVGLAMPLPAMSGAEPWTDSK